MWPDTFEQRLASWANLKCHIKKVPLDQALLMINDWWFRAPIVNHYLHYDDVANWPDPWQLLNDNIYCELARALGIVYTLIDADLPGITDIDILCTNNDNLVQIKPTIYILNWAPGEMLNILSQTQKIKKQISSQELQSKYN